MSWYADSQLALSEGNDYGDKECPECEGTGETEETNCCGATFLTESNICSDCKEHADNTCLKCNGSGMIPKDVEDAIDDEWEARCED